MGLVGKMLETFQNKKDRSLTYLHGEAASSSVENAGITYQAPSLLYAGGSASDVAFLSTATNLFFALMLIKLPNFLRSGDALKRATIFLAAISALAWLPLILVPLIVANVSPALLIVLWVISLLPALLLGPIRDKWMADLIPARRMGSYFGLRQIVAAGSYLTTFYLMGYLMDHNHGIFHDSFMLVFSIAFLGSLLSFILYVAVRSSEVHATPVGGGFGLLDFLHETRQSNMSVFMTYVTLITFAASISGAFFSVYMLQDLHFTFLTYTVIVSVEFMARIASLTIWGKVVDRSGAIKLLKVVSFIIPVIPLMWLFSSNVFYLGLTQFISGISWAAFDLSNQTYISSASPESKRLHYIVYQRCVITMASAMGPLLGAWLLTRIFPVFGSQILTIFLISGALRFAIVISLVGKLKSNESTPVNENAVPSAVQVIYQAERRVVTEKDLCFPRYNSFKPQSSRRTVVRSRQPAPTISPSPVFTGNFQSGTPYQQTQYQARRQAAAEMLRGRTVTKYSEPEIHRLVRQGSATA